MTSSQDQRPGAEMPMTDLMMEEEENKDLHITVEQEGIDIYLPDIPSFSEESQSQHPESLGLCDFDRKQSFRRRTSNASSEASYTSDHPT